MGLTRRQAGAVLAVLCLGSAVTMVALGSRLTFFNDDWYILLGRPGWSTGTLLEPHNGHLSLLPVLAYKVLVGLFGLDSQLPFRLALATAVIVLAVLVFVYVRERAGDVLALAAAALLLFLGPAWQDLLWFSSINHVGSLASGVAVLLALERRTRRADALACLLLVVSIGFANLGVCFVFGAAIAVLLRRRPADAWIAAIPAALFALWWLVYGRGEQSGLSLDNLPHVPFYVLDSIASGLATLTGLSASTERGLDPYAWGRPLLALAALGIAVWVLRGGRPSPGVLPVAGAALSFWALTGASFIPNWREAEASHLQIITATFVILVAAELFRPVRLRPPALAACAGLTLVFIASNLVALHDGYRVFREESAVARADLGALDLGRGHISSDFRLLPDVAGSIYMTGIYAGPYYRERDVHGSPAYSPAEIATASARARSAADLVLAAGYGLRLEPAAAASPAPGAARCSRLQPEADTGPRVIDLAPGALEIGNRGAAVTRVRLVRFAAEGFPVDLGDLGPRSSARLRIPADAAPDPWRLSVEGGSEVEICKLAGPA